MRSVRLVCALLLVGGLTGCRHRAVPTIPVIAQAPVALEPMPQLKLPPRIAEVPVPTAPLPTVELPKKKLRRLRHKPATAPPAGTPGAVTQSSSAQVASATPPPPIASVIGSLTAGEDASPERRRSAADLIASNDRRLKALPKDVVSDQHESVVRVRNFDRDARTALKSGDAGGALILAEKAQVLLDDLEANENPE